MVGRAVLGENTDGIFVRRLAEALGIETRACLFNLRHEHQSDVPIQDSSTLTMLQVLLEVLEEAKASI